MKLLVMSARASASALYLNCLQIESRLRHANFTCSPVAYRANRYNLKYFPYTINF